MSVVTRFAPSPTGFLHIGGARTALFNYLYAKHHGGQFLLRIEDTDKKRSSQEAIDAILEGMSWLGLECDGEVIYQSAQEERHKAIAYELVKKGQAYYCYCSEEELAQMRAEAEAEGKRFKYNRKWRDEGQTPPADVKPVIRIKAPLEGNMIIDDLVQGRVEVPNDDLDDFIILRADGSPTYMLAVVVDDHDMAVTHAIRGDDHLTNAFRQKIIYDAMGWSIPQFAHIPLIHGTDGAKLSKRHGALGIDAYREMGYLPEAICNYLLRLGWSHGDDEIISREQAIEWFGTESIGKSPARIDFDKMANINAHYIKESDGQRLLDLMLPMLPDITEQAKHNILAGMEGLKERSKTLNELAENAKIYIHRVPYTEKAFKLVNENGPLIVQMAEALNVLENWDINIIKEAMNDFAKSHELKMSNVLPALRAAVCGTMEAPGIFEVLAILGKDETLQRIGHL